MEVERTVASDDNRATREQSLSQSLDSERALRAALEEAIRLQDEVLRSITHELRNPLNSIRLWTQVLRERGADPALVTRALAGLEHATALQDHQIETLLDASRMAVGRLRIEVEPVDLGAVVQHAVESVRPMAAAQDVMVDTEAGTRGGLVRCDPQRLEHAMWHLLAHAIRSTPRSGRVRVRLERAAEGAARIVVSHVARPVERAADPRVSARLTGAGDLGLTLARHIVELHGGTMAMATQPGGGATISIELPASLRAAAMAGVAAGPSNGSTEGRKLSLGGVRVLVVEDEMEARESMRLLLERLGAEVAAAASARQALETLDRSTFDVLISDIAMPGEDGYALLKAIRSLGPDRGGRLPAVAVTAGSRPDDRRRALAEGFQAYLPKPVDMLELVRQVSALSRR
jgi:CheY-like chemotaxis protein